MNKRWTNHNEYFIEKARLYYECSVLEYIYIYIHIYVNEMLISSFGFP